MFAARCVLFMAVLALATQAHGAAEPPLSAGKGEFTFRHGDGALRVFYFKPSKASAATPVWFVMHGTNRNADDYRDNWVELGTQHQALIVVPQFPKEEFPTYHLGEVMDKKGTLRPRDKTLFALMEQLFSDVVSREHLACERYCIFGHSAGGQFVHRMVLFSPENRIALAVAANAGWYTLPDRSRAMPYGLEKAACDDQSLTRSFAMPLCVLLGDADTDPMHPLLNHSPGAEEQGPHRLARGRNFYDTAQREAGRLNAPFRWTLTTVPGVAHSNGQMAPAAAKLMAQASQPVSSAK